MHKPQLLNYYSQECITEGQSQRVSSAPTPCFPVGEAETQKWVRSWPKIVLVWLAESRVQGLLKLSPRIFNSSTGCFRSNSSIFHQTDIWESSPSWTKVRQTQGIQSSGDRVWSIYSSKPSECLDYRQAPPGQSSRSHLPTDVWCGSISGSKKMGLEGVEVEETGWDVMYKNFEKLFKSYTIRLC